MAAVVGVQLVLLAVQFKGAVRYAIGTWRMLLHAWKEGEEEQQVVDPKNHPSHPLASRQVLEVDCFLQKGPCGGFHARWLAEYSSSAPGIVPPRCQNWACRRWCILGSHVWPLKPKKDACLLNKSARLSVNTFPTWNWAEHVQTARICLHGYVSKQGDPQNVP